MIENAPTYFDEANDPEVLAFDLEWIRGFPHSVLLTQGYQSTPLFTAVITKLAEALPSVEVRRFSGAGHDPHMECPEAYVKALETFIHGHTKK